MLGEDPSIISDKVNGRKYKKDEDFLGEGSFGRVFKRKIGSKMYAIKAIKRKGMSTWDKNNLERELKHWPDLSKKIPNSVPKLLGCTHDSNFTYIIQELLYKDLESEEFIEHLKTLDLEGRIRLMISISDALSELHDMMFIHNDFKPANLMFPDDKFERVKLIDFGFVTAEKARFSGGTPIYNAPEKINKGIVIADPAIDVWAMGMTFFEILANFDYKKIFLQSSCYDSKKFSMMCHNKLWTKFKEGMSALYHAEIDEEFSGDLEDAQNIFEVILSMLNYEPDRRPTAAEVSEALEELLSESMTAACKAKKSKKKKAMIEPETDDEEERIEKKKIKELSKGTYWILNSQDMAERPEEYINVNNMVLRPRRKQVDYRLHLI